MSLSPGTKIGVFEILAPLGAGGMGEVYRATDTRLKREVAIKVLPEDVTRDRDRLARFEREAHLLASMNHPNIGAIYGLEESGDSRCLVLELIEGETLAEKIARGPVPLDGSVRIALQIAEALEAAHEKGIIHRDFKPANVKVTPEGVVKVLDFGLAKAHGGDGSAGSPDISLSPTMTAAATQAGMILGTAAYMSPEQAAGQMVDRRADVWSFGVVMLELLTGRKTFVGETVSHTLASVLKEDPDWDRLPRDCPSRLRALLQRCLHKKPRKRLQSIGEARVVLEEYLEAPASFSESLRPAAVIVDAPPRWKSVLPWGAAALLGLTLLSVPWWPGAAVPERETRRLTLQVPQGEVLFRGYGSSAVISPDGTRVAYVSEQSETRRLYIQYFDQWKGAVVAEGPTSSTGPYNPFFSPDGQWLGYVTRTELKKVPVRGGSPITLCAVERNRGATWGPDGTIVFAHSPASGLSRVSASGGEPEPLTIPDEAAGESTHRWPQFLPGGRGILFTSLAESDDFNTASIEVLDMETNQRKVLHKGGTDGRYVSSGHIVYYNQGTLFAVPFDAATLEITGSAAPAVEAVSGGRSQGGAQFSVSQDGTLVYAKGESETSSTLVWVDRSGTATPLWNAPQGYANPAISPDGLKVAVEVESEGNVDIWVYDTVRDVPTRMTFAEGDDTRPLWSPDGVWIYYATEKEGISAIQRTLADGSGQPEPVLKQDKSVSPVSISPDGAKLTYTLSVTSQADVWILPLDGGDPVPFATGPAIDYDGRFSPDGRWIVYGSNESGGFEVYVRPSSPDQRGKWQISRDGGAYPRWSADGRAVIFRTLGSGAVHSVPVEPDGETFRAGRGEVLYTGPFLMSGSGDDHFDVAPDGDRFVMVQTGDTSAETHEHIQVVTGWLDELERTFDAPDGARR